MYGNMVSEPAAKGQGIDRIDGCKEIVRVKEFYDALKKFGYTFTALLKEAAESSFLEKNFSFSMQIQYRDNVLCLNELKDGLTVMWKRCIGCVFFSRQGKKEDSLKGYVYYVIAVNQADLDLTFLRCAEEVYYEWIVEEFSAAMNAVKDQDMLGTLNQDEVQERFQRDVSEKFHWYMREIYAIPLNIITAISGIYYERETCCSNLSFCLVDISRNDLEGMELEQPIKLETKMIKRIRKQLQTGKKDQCLMLCRKGSEWEVRGLYKADGVRKNSINFQITRHMVWSMWVGGKLAVCSENGNYIINSKLHQLANLEEKYWTLFGKKLEGKMREVCLEAFDQKHGTILVIIGEDTDDTKDFAKKEAERLAPTGVKIKPDFLPKGFIKSLTSIDGAVIVNENGKCYGYSMILDGPAGSSQNQDGKEQQEKGVGEKEGSTLKQITKGNPDYGARHNSAKRYIQRCEENGLTAIEIVVSEDGPVTIFSTGDDLIGGRENGK